jgi:Adenylate and Guanylate cyclase catalytic domain
MESHGMPGRIQITRATYELLADEFECDPRGTIAVKGKGEIESWYLIGPRGDRGAGCQRRGGASRGSPTEGASPSEITRRPRFRGLS